MLTGPLENMKKPAFSGHETFPMRYGWVTKMMDFYNPEQTKETLLERGLHSSIDTISPFEQLFSSSCANIFEDFLTNFRYRGCST